MKKSDFIITHQPIEVDSVIRRVIHPNAGAVNMFIGTVRELTNGKRTLFLEYEAYVPMAEKQLALIGQEIEKKWLGSRVAITHRIGKLDISDAAVVIAVSSPHRDAAFEASRYAIEQIKKIVPIWKKEHGENGEMWIGNQEGTLSYPDIAPKGAEK